MVSSEPSSDQPLVDVRSAGLRYGLLLGLVSAAYFVVLAISGVDTNQGWGRWSSTILSIALLVLAHIYYKDHNNGFMSYGQGVGISFWMGLVTGVIVSAFMLVYISYIDTDFMKNIEALQQQAMLDQGLSEEQIDQAMEIARKFTSPGFFFAFGLLGQIFIMVLLGLACSVFTQRKDERMESL